MADESKQEELEKRIARFKEKEAALRMSVTAAMFKIPNNPELYKKKYATGFTKLDDALSGGFSSGLHGLGAISSAGKSTLALQMAENMANMGEHVLYFSLEMAREDIAAKAISRQIYLDTSLDPRLAKTSAMLQSKKIASNFSTTEWSIVTNAAEKIEKLGERITIIDSRSCVKDVEKISQYIKNFVLVYNITPVVIIDYLQIMQMPDKMRGLTDKQMIDYDVANLKALSDRYDLPILLISSLNRDNYNREASFKAFKDSGNIEYSCDTLMALQFKGVGGENFDIDKEKAKPIKDMELYILKQRYGRTGQKISLRFTSEFNYFEEVDEKKKKEMEQETLTF